MAYTKDEIRTVLFQAIGKATKRDPATLSPELKWLDDLDFKSVQGRKVCGILNYSFKITVPLTDLIKCDTLEDAVEMLDSKVN